MHSHSLLISAIKVISEEIVEHYFDILMFSFTIFEPAVWSLYRESLKGALKPVNKWKLCLRSKCKYFIIKIHEANDLNI